MIAEKAGMYRASPTPKGTASTAIQATLMCPENASAAIAPTAIPRSTSAPIIGNRRSDRSASTPAGTTSSTCGSVQATPTAPSAAGLPVRS